MAKAKIVIALGGNALQASTGQGTAEEQLLVVKETCRYLADVICGDYQVALVHGNGPQVGRILLASETARDVTPSMPFDVCGAMSQGYIGYHIQQSLHQELADKGCADIPVVTLVTQVLVDVNDPGFQNPTKPIGPFYSEEKAAGIAREKGYVMKEDAGRGWRRVVASPLPIGIVEEASIHRLWGDAVLVTCGGGGIPVVRREDGSLEGVPAVIDKDFAAELLAEKLDADILMILTEVDRISLNFRQSNQVDLNRLSVSEARQYIDEGHFAAGSMLPKVMAAARFAGSAPGKKAIVTSLYKVMDALDGRTGTVVSG